ncbi:cytochrome b5-like [Coccinella septempunctata]|uniref:cytochrome b5-like n=1 Tax=Coccinella septempunctata TaxID=41139 RepID=UPI001D05D281|nr:cytochrome b5-like [Coccinella septempunctata]
MAPLEKYSRNDVKNHNDSNSTWLIIENKVYDVTTFLNEHPGGEETILEEAGKDATEAFISAGHSSEAREMLRKYEIGELIDSEKTKKGTRIPNIFGTGRIVSQVIFVALTVGVFIAIRMYHSSRN